jgi:hypothetical protein
MYHSLCFSVLPLVAHVVCQQSLLVQGIVSSIWIPLHGTYQWDNAHVVVPSHQPKVNKTGVHHTLTPCLHVLWIPVS